jgi:hypothetical protein
MTVPCRMAERAGCVEPATVEVLTGGDDHVRHRMCLRHALALAEALLLPGEHRDEITLRPFGDGRPAARGDQGTAPEPGCGGCREIGPLLVAPGTSGRPWRCKRCGTVWTPADKPSGRPS